MVDITTWMPDLTGRLQAAFGGRLLFVGLQGSYRRGEATEHSDIDVVTVLESLSLPDLDVYRTIVAAMPEGEKACGFIGGRAELLAWPKHEIFQLEQDTEPCHGSLAGLLPAVTPGDIAEGARIGAANLYHAACHAWLYDPPEARVGILRDLQKGCFFILQTLHYLRTGAYIRARRELLPRLTGDEAALLQAAIAPQGVAGADPAVGFNRLIRWSAAVLAELGQPDEC